MNLFKNKFQIINKSFNKYKNLKNFANVKFNTKIVSFFNTIFKNDYKDTSQKYKMNDHKTNMINYSKISPNINYCTNFTNNKTSFLVKHNIKKYHMSHKNLDNVLKKNNDNNNEKLIRFMMWYMCGTCACIVAGGFLMAYVSVYHIMVSPPETVSFLNVLMIPPVLTMGLLYGAFVGIIWPIGVPICLMLYCKHREEIIKIIIKRSYII